MDKFVMTLLVRRDPEEDARWPYAVQIALRVELAPGEMTAITSVRLITNQGALSSILAAMDFYHPYEWRAASPAEQAEYVARYDGNPRPWYCVMRSLCKNVYDYGGAGDRDTNNGQLWTETACPGSEWKTARRLEQSCHEELEADWRRSLGREAQPVMVSGRSRRNSFLTTS